MYREDLPPPGLLQTLAFCSALPAPAPPRARRRRCRRVQQYVKAAYSHAWLAWLHESFEDEEEAAAREGGDAAHFHGGFTMRRRVE